MSGSGVQPRVLYLGMRWDHGIPERGESFEHQTFHAALAAWERIGSLRAFDFVGLARRHGVRRMSSLLLEEVQAFAPDVLFAVFVEPALDPEMGAIREIGRSTPCKTIGWFCDSQLRYESFDRPWAEVLGLAVTTSAAAYEKAVRDGLGERFVRSQWGAAPGFRRLPSVPRDLDVSFVGPPLGGRRAAVEHLRRSGLRVATWGSGWGERLPLARMVEVFNRSKVSLNLSGASPGADRQIEARVFEVPACGGFLLTDDAEGLGDHYVPGQEIETFRTTGELAEKARLFVADADARERIALAGHRRTLAEHGMEKRLEEVFSRAGLLTAAGASPGAGPALLGSTQLWLPPGSGGTRFSREGGRGPAAVRRDSSRALAAVTVTSRPERLLGVLDQLLRQSRRPDSWVVLVQSDGAGLKGLRRLEERARAAGIATVLERRPAGWPRGRVRNAAMALASEHGFAAVVEDGEGYGPGYFLELETSLQAEPEGEVHGIRAFATGTSSRELGAEELAIEPRGAGEVGAVVRGSRTACCHPATLCFRMDAWKRNGLRYDDVAEAEDAPFWEGPEEGRPVVIERPAGSFLSVAPGRTVVAPPCPEAAPEPRAAPAEVSSPGAPGPVEEALPAQLVAAVRRPSGSEASPAGALGGLVLEEPALGSGIVEVRNGEGRIRVGTGLLGSRPLRSPGIEMVLVVGGVLARGLRTGQVHALNPVAALVLELCDGANEVEEIVSAVELVFGPGHPAREDVEAVLGTLRAAGLVDAFPE